MSLKIGDLIPIGGGGGYSLLSNVENFEVDSVYDQIVRLNWKDPNDVIVDGILITEWAGTQIRGKKGNYPSNEKDGVLFIDSKNRNQYQNTPLEITGLDNDDEYFFMAFPYTDKNVFTVDSANRATGTPMGLDDPSGGPGSPYLIAGTLQQGFFGEVPASELFTASEIASACGISQGTPQFENEPWLKFAIDGKIIYRPRKAIRHTINYNTLDLANCVYGGSEGKRVTKNGQTYIVRLMKGALTDPALYNSTDRGAKGSEWNRLMLPIHEKILTKDWYVPAYIEDDLPVWSHNFGTGINGLYSDNDLMTDHNFGSGAYAWCQETIVGSSNERIIRGYSGVGFAAKSSTTTTHDSRGWVPVLEVIK